MRAQVTLLSLYRNVSGAIGIEYALTLPFLILILVGIVDYGGLAYRESQLEAAARSGGQFALIDGNSENTVGIQEAVYDAMDLDPLSGQLSFAISYDRLCPDGSVASSIEDFCDAGDTIEPGYFMTLSVSETYDMWMSYPLIPASTLITGEVVIRVLETS